MSNVVSIEKWEPLADYEGLYEISNLGRVKNITKNFLIKPSNRNGYQTVNLTKGRNNRKSTSLHRLVAQVFITNPDNKPFVNHKNGIKTDNRVDNLEWCTQSENMKHSYEVLKQRKSHPNVGKVGQLSHCHKVILMMDLQGLYIDKFYGSCEAARKTNSNHRHITECCNGKRKTHNGYKWAFDKSAKNNQAILQFALDGSLIKEWKSSADACKTLKIDTSSMSNCCNGKINQCGGYKWKFKRNQINMETILKLGEHYVSNFIQPNHDHSNDKKYSLDLVMDHRLGAARLKEQPPGDMMWKTKYWYRSDINAGMVRQLKDIAEEVSSRVKPSDGDIWLDIACNTGVMFDYIPNSYIKLGIDPADDTFHVVSSKKAFVIQDYFSYDAYRATGYGNSKAKVITTIAMFYDVPDPDVFIGDIVKILDDNGVWVIQLSYTPLMIKQMAFDNLCHEHYYYYSLNSIKKLVEPHGLKIVDASVNDTNGGSVRIYMQKTTASPNSFANQQIRDCCDVRVESLLSWETSHCDISDPHVWAKYQKDLEDLKEKTVSFIKAAKAEGKTVAGIGASTKGNTLLQYFGLDNTLIDFISERSPAKFGLQTIGTNIPIVSEEEARERKPDYMLMLPWHFVSEIVAREQDYLHKGGKFIVPCPKFEIIEK